MKIGDQFTIKENTKFKWEVNVRDLKNATIKGLTPGVYKVFHIQEGLIFFDDPKYTGNQYFVSTLEEFKKLKFRAKKRPKGDRFKVGDFVTLVSVPESSFGLSLNKGDTFEVQVVNNFSVGVYNNNGFLRIPIRYFREATPVETSDYKEKNVIMKGVGSQNATLLITKNPFIRILNTTGSIKASFLKTVITKFSNYYNLGSYSLVMCDRTSRIFRIGCAMEDNRVSFNELTSVYNAWHNLKNK